MVKLEFKLKPVKFQGWNFGLSFLTNTTLNLTPQSAAGDSGLTYLGGTKWNKIIFVLINFLEKVC